VSHLSDNTDPVIALSRAEEDAALLEYFERRAALPATPKSEVWCAEQVNRLLGEMDEFFARRASEAPAEAVPEPPDPSQPEQPQRSPRQRKPRQPTLASVSKQARKAGFEVARYEIKPDGTVVVITGKSESTEPNPWLADLRREERQ